MNTYIFSDTFFDTVSLKEIDYRASVGVELPDSSAEKSVFQFKFTDSLFFILLVLVAVIAYVKISGKKYYNRIFTSITNFSYSNSFFKEKNLAHSWYNFILLVGFFVSFSIFLFVFFNYYDIKYFYDNKWLQLAVNFIFLISALFLHISIMFILSLITDKIILYRKYLFFFLNLLRIFGTLNVFLLFGAVFAENTIQTVFIYLIITVFIFAYLLRLYRILLIFFENQFPLYYMILYFCTLEIIPILLLVKIAMVNFS